MRKVTIGVSAALLLAMLGAARYFLLRVDSSLKTISQQVSSEGNYGFRVVRWSGAGSQPGTNRGSSSLDASGFELVSPPTSYTTGVEAAGTMYLAGPGGLTVRKGPASQPVLLRTGLDLPSSPIVALASGRLRGEATLSLLAATQGGGLLILNSDAPNSDATSPIRQVQQILPGNAAARDITAILPLDSGDVLIGTRTAGLLIFDGKTLRVFQRNLANLAVTALAGDEGDLWIGTRASGVLHWRAGQLETFGPSEGLPDPLVEDVVIGPEGVFAGTPLGVAQFHKGRLSRVIARGLFAHALALQGDTLLVATIDQGVHEVALTPRASGRTPIKSRT